MAQLLTYIDHCTSICCSCALCSLVDVFPCVYSFLTPTMRGCFFVFQTVLPANSNSSITQPPGLTVVRRFSILILYSLHPYLPSFETPQKTPRLFFFVKCPPKKSFSYPLHLYQHPVLSPPCRPYLILRSHGFTIHASVRLPVMSCPTLSPTRMSFVLRLSFHTDDEPRATLLQWITIMSLEP